MYGMKKKYIVIIQRCMHYKNNIPKVCKELANNGLICFGKHPLDNIQKGRNKKETTIKIEIDMLCLYFNQECNKIQYTYLFFTY